MKKFFISVGVALAILVALLASGVVIFYHAVFKCVSLGNDITWEYSWRHWEANKPDSALMRNGSFVVGPHSFMELWGAYPYIAGKFVVYDAIDKDTLGIERVMVGMI